MRSSPSPNRPSSLPKPLENEDLICGWIGELTGKNAEQVGRLLRLEYETPGYAVSSAFEATGLERYVWSDELIKFYGQTDSFLYELVIWNMNRLKCKFRRWIARHLRQADPSVKKILCIGDGLGFDSAFLAHCGYEVSYYEVSGYSEQFARKVFAETAPQVKVVTDAREITAGSYDAVVCLDVLEHVPDPADYARQICHYVRPEGYLIVHAPFYMIHPSAPTHLKTNTKWCGSLKLYTRRGLKLIDGGMCWDPLLFKKTEKAGPAYYLSWKLNGLRMSGCILSMGRLTVKPFMWVNRYRNQNKRWFKYSRQDNQTQGARL